MIQNKIILIFLVLVTTLTSCNAQIKNTKIVTTKIWGNCGMCKKTIETAGNKKRVSLIVWNKETKQAEISYDSTKTTLDIVLKRIANAGYDNENYTATNEVYNNLQGCCQYDRK